MRRSWIIQLQVTTLGEGTRRTDNRPTFQISWTRDFECHSNIVGNITCFAVGINVDSGVGVGGNLMSNDNGVCGGNDRSCCDRGSGDCCGNIFYHRIDIHGRRSLFSSGGCLVLDGVGEGNHGCLSMGGGGHHHQMIGYWSTS